ncbi:MAG: histidinol-phosphatase HisJ family protein [Anaerovoracaceae bacterium]
MYDYHTHTSFSDDCDSPMEEMILGAIKKGIKEIVITDHLDPEYPDPEFPFVIDFDQYLASIEQCREKYGQQIKILQGIELGIQHGKATEECNAVASSIPFDFIIGSFHCFNGMDLFTTNYKAMEQEKILPAYYEYMYRCLKEFNQYDVLGHFNVIDRYLYFKPDYQNAMEIIEAILQHIIAQGKGIEVNTSSYRYGMGERTTPSREILTLYKDLGGEILTIGSDAHRPMDLAYGLDRAAALAKSCGFKYFTTFEQRKPTMLPL